MLEELVSIAGTVAALETSGLPAPTLPRRAGEDNHENGQELAKSRVR